jgi:hypothetical protein
VSVTDTAAGKRERSKGKEFFMKNLIKLTIIAALAATVTALTGCGSEETVSSLRAVNHHEQPVTAVKVYYVPENKVIGDFENLNITTGNFKTFVLDLYLVTSDRISVNVKFGANGNTSKEFSSGYSDNITITLGSDGYLLP